MLHQGLRLGSMLLHASHNAIHDFIANSYQLLVITATGIALDRNQIRHHIGGHAAGNNTDIGGGFLINATITLNLGQGLGSDHHSVNALFRLQATMGLLAVHADFILILTGSPYHDFTGSALAVQSIAHGCAQLRLIHATGAIDTALLSNSEEDLNIAMLDTAFQKKANALENAFHAALIVTTQNSGAIAVEHAVPLHNCGTTAGLHPVHVGRKEHAHSAFLGPRQKGPQIAAITAQLSSCIILFHSKAQAL